MNSSTKANTKHGRRKEILSGGMTKNVCEPQNILRLQLAIFQKSSVGFGAHAPTTPSPSGSYATATALSASAGTGIS